MSLSIEQIQQRASDKLEAKLFYAIKDLQEINLEIDGVLPSILSTDQLLTQKAAQENEILVLEHIFTLIEKSY